MKLTFPRLKDRGLIEAPSPKYFLAAASKFPRLVESEPETAANTLPRLIHPTNYLPDRQMRQLGRAVLEEGGFTERLDRECLRRRGNKSDGQDRIRRLKTAAPRKFRATVSRRSWVTVDRTSLRENPSAALLKPLPKVPPFSPWKFTFFILKPQLFFWHGPCTIPPSGPSRRRKPKRNVKVRPGFTHQR